MKHEEYFQLPNSMEITLKLSKHLILLSKLIILSKKIILIEKYWKLQFRSKIVNVTTLRYQRQFLFQCRHMKSMKIAIDVSIWRCVI